YTSSCGSTTHAIQRAPISRWHQNQSRCHRPWFMRRASRKASRSNPVSSSSGGAPLRRGLAEALIPGPVRKPPPLYTFGDATGDGPTQPATGPRTAMSGWSKLWRRGLALGPALAFGTRDRVAVERVIFDSRILGEARTVDVFLPRVYGRDSSASYAVLYAND